MHHLHFNHLAVLVAAILQWILGALWYSLLFAKPWMALTGHKQGERPKGAILAMIGSFFGGLILCFVVAHFVLWSGATTICWGLFVGFISWLGLIAVPLFSEMLYEGRPFKLFAIYAGYWLVALLVTGGLLAAWH
jgi:hypothetical protein